MLTELWIEGILQKMDPKKYPKKPDALWGEKPKPFGKSEWIKALKSLSTLKGVVVTSKRFKDL